MIDAGLDGDDAGRVNSSIFVVVVQGDDSVATALEDQNVAGIARNPQPSWLREPCVVKVRAEVFFHEGICELPSLISAGRRGESRRDEGAEEEENDDRRRRGRGGGS